MDKHLIYVYSDSCSKCHMISKYVEAFAEREWLELDIKLNTEYDWELTTVPTLVIIEWDDRKLLIDEDLINYIRPQ